MHPRGCAKVTVLGTAAEADADSDETQIKLRSSAIKRLH